MNAKVIFAASMAAIMVLAVLVVPHAAFAKMEIEKPQKPQKAEDWSQIQPDAQGRGEADDVPNPEPIAPGDNHRGK